MTAIGTTLTASRRRSTLAPVVRMFHIATAALSAMRAGWADWAQSGQLGPAPETEISRHTGARI